MDAESRSVNEPRKGVLKMRFRKRYGPPPWAEGLISLQEALAKAYKCFRKRKENIRKSGAKLTGAGPAGNLHEEMN